MKPRGIFYPGPMHLFWTTGIYYLNEMSRRFETTVILENADNKDVEIIEEITEFRIKRILSFKGKTKLAKHLQYRRIVRDVCKEVRPDVILADHDMYPFEVYLLREGKRVGSLNVCYQSGIMEDTVRNQYKRLLGNDAIKLREKYCIPFDVGVRVANAKCYLKEIWYYFLGPILSGAAPFPGKSSAFVQRGRNGMRDSDYSIVFGERERKLSIEDGVAERKIIVIPHPLTWKSSEGIRERIFSKKIEGLNSGGKRIVSVFVENLSDNYRVRRGSGEIIQKKEIYAMWEKVLLHIAKIFPEAIIVLKKHPAQKKDDPFLLYLRKITQHLPNIQFLLDDIQAMSLAASSSVIISETSTVLYTASLCFTDKCIVSLDLDGKVFGNLYRNMPGITYVSTYDQLNELGRKPIDSLPLIVERSKAPIGSEEKFMAILLKNMADQ